MHRLILFGLAGLPAFVVALALNYFLVRRAMVPVAVAYALVLLVQTVTNYFTVRLIVFRGGTRRGRERVGEFALFSAGVIGFRILDWALYVAIVALTPLHFLAAQVLNIAVFLVPKFLYSRRVIDHG